jgi:NADPH:quinone reductase-like Zn-dependent oxidoreductase
MTQSSASREGAIKAIVRAASGSPELRDVDVPVPTENEVLVRVHASSLNDYDLSLSLPQDTHLYKIPLTLLLKSDSSDGLACQRKLSAG